MNVIILYNPNSTGNSKTYATEFRDKLLQADTERTLKVTLRGTEHAGHAEEIATEHAKNGQKCIIISSSGDGGYHELINGALSQKSSAVITGLLPAGNANDHYNALGGDMDATLARITKDTPQTIDVLRVSGMIDGKPWARYAHSYAAIGVAAKAAKDLTEKRPNFLSEKWLVAKSLLSFRYVKIIESEGARRYSGLIFSNIALMSKVIKLAENAPPNDGKFEINRIRFHSKLRLVLYLLTAATIGLKPSESLQQTTFTTTKPTALQLDGEVYTVDAGCTVTIESQHNALCYV